ncbi:MAG: hypothetical protein M3Q27_16340 [Actinomycetota bacterium]|nr:hypothetical protein [Actinomycetota bacterium]
MLNTLSVVAASVGVGFASAVIPVVNAEAAVAGTALKLSAALVVVAAVGVALGQTAGKLLVYEAGRRGSAVRRKRRKDRPVRPWQQKALEMLRSRWRGSGVVLLSSSVGLPPLAIVSVAAGTAGMRRGDFAVCCLLGRCARFLSLAMPIALASS